MAVRGPATVPISAWLARARASPADPPSLLWPCHAALCGLNTCWFYVCQRPFEEHALASLRACLPAAGTVHPMTLFLRDAAAVWAVTPEPVHDCFGS